MATIQLTNAYAGNIVRNPLRRDGTSQHQRFPEALETDYVKIDERQLDDFLVFANQFADLINFYDDSNRLAGTWKSFFEKDLSINIALISREDLSQYKTDFTAAWSSITDDLTPTTEDLSAAIKITSKLAQKIEGWYNAISDETSLNAVIYETVESDLQQALVELISYRNGADSIAVAEGTNLIEIDLDHYSSDWFDPSVNYSQTTGLLGITDSKPYTGTGAAAQIKASKKRFQANFEVFYNTALYIVGEAPNHLEESLSYQYHEPHMALFITFVQLFRHAQDHLNTLTDKHLEFYYKEVLQILEREENPDQVHLVFEPAQGTEEHLVPAGTKLDAGKDDTGKKVFFETDRDLILNKAEIAELKTIFIGRDANGVAQRVFGATKANSMDGLGAEFDGEDKSWPLLGEDQEGKAAGEASMPDADLGWAISSPVLRMEEGDRDIRVVVKYKKASSVFGNFNTAKERAQAEVELCYNLSTKITGPEGWLDLEINELSIVHEEIHLPTCGVVAVDSLFGGIAEFDTDGTNGLGCYENTDFTTYGYLVFKVSLSSSDAQVVDYSAEIHGHSFEANYPLINVSFNNQGGNLAIGPGDVTGIHPVAWEDNSGVSDGEVYAERGRLYKKNSSGTDISYSSIIDFLEEAIPHVYDSEESYTANGITFVQHEGKVYYQTKQSSSPEPYNGSEYWKYRPDLFSTGLTDYDADTPYALGDIVLHFERVYEAIKVSTSPSPTESDQYWQFDMDLRANPYHYLEGMALKNVTVKVDVAGYGSLLLQNDQGKLNPNQTVLPFTNRPLVGSKCYIGSQEVFQKSLESLKLNLEWEGLPSVNFNNHYSAYPSNNKPGGNQDYKVAVSYLDNRKWVASTNTKPLFANNTGKPLVDAEIDLDDTLSSQASRNPGLAAFSALDSSRYQGFIRLQLQALSGKAADFMFGHKQYNPLYTASIVAATTATSGGSGTTGDLVCDDTGSTDQARDICLVNNLAPGTAPTLPNEPYTPMLSKITMDYSSSETIDMEASTRADYDSRVERFFHVLPFGEAEVHPYLQSVGDDIELVHSFLEEGHLYIGMQNLTPPQNLTLYFQFQEGTGDPERERPEVTWSFQSTNGWMELDPEDIVSDTTKGLLKSGVVTIALSRKASSEIDTLPTGKFWLRVTTDNNTEAINQIIEIKTQAVTATYAADGNDPNRLAIALPGETITKMAVKSPAVKSVTQPYNSFDGRVAETSRQYYTRVSERLRHKQRSINIYDYERMVLEQFPDIYKAKCLNHTRLVGTGAEEEYCELAPGNVLVITVPDLRNKNGVNALEPRTSLARLEEIRSYLLQHISPFVELKVKNPLYEEIRVSCDVGFHPEYDAAFYAKKLREDIKKFLSPWAFDEGEEIVFGGRIHKSVILNFMEEQPYVDFVINFQLDHFINQNNRVYNVEEAITTTSRSILVSAEDHLVKPLQSGEFACPGDEVYSGIAFWVIEGDFVVS